MPLVGSPNLPSAFGIDRWKAVFSFGRDNMGTGKISVKELLLYVEKESFVLSKGQPNHPQR